MTSAYYIKAYYTKQDQQQPEIRRFAIDITSENDVYHELRTKVASFQPDNQLNNFTLQYNDEENERITFSSNDELRSAIALNKDTNTLKVFVTFHQTIPQQQQQQQPPQQDSANKECHVGVECDSCKAPVVGFRYKCFVCPNYDLCEKCSSAGIHSEHNMIKITKAGNFQHPNGPRYHHSHGRHHRQARPLPQFVPNRAFIEQVQAQIPQWLPNRSNTTQFRAHMQQHLDSIKTNTQSHMQNSKQYLESVGQYLQQALSPFGIDCDYHVDEQKPPTNQEEQVPTTNQQQEEQAATNNQQHEEQASAGNQQEEQILTTETVPKQEPDAVPKYPDLNQTNDNNQEQTASSLIPPVEESTVILNPLEKSINNCVERMEAMGFTNINGALRELIRSKQGDINAVLDAINPRHYQE